MRKQKGERAVMPQQTRAALEDIEVFYPAPHPRRGSTRQQTPELGTLLVDHANCEKKAAATALSLMHRYTDNASLLKQNVPIFGPGAPAFRASAKIMERRGIHYGPLSASRYAQGLHAGVRRQEPGRLTDTLVVGALIEARLANALRGSRRIWILSSLIFIDHS